MRRSSSQLGYILEAERKAYTIRSDLGLGSDAIGNLFELLEHLGPEVIVWPMGEEGPDGFYVHKAEFVLVVVNSSKRFSRQRFTAAHALGHHLFDGQSEVDVDVFVNKTVPERRANAFAAHFLMPEEGVIRWLRRDGWHGEGPFPLPPEEVVHLGRHFGMSYEATLYQLRDLGWLAGGRVEELKLVSPDRVARRLGYDLEAEEMERGRQVLPPGFVSQALAAYGSGDISLMRLGELLRTTEDGAERLARDAGIEPNEPSLEDLVEEARDA